MNSTHRGSVRRLTWRSRWAGVLIGGVIGVLATGTGTAAAQTPDRAPAAPPAAAIPVAAQNGVAETGGDQNYWADDLCHYFATGGEWYTDLCLRYQADANGAPDPAHYSLYANLGGGELGAEMQRHSWETPQRLAVGFPDSAGNVASWLHLVVATNQQGQQMLVLEQPSTTPGAVVGGTTSSAPDMSNWSQAQKDQWAALQQQYNDTMACVSAITLGGGCVRVVG